MQHTERAYELEENKAYVVIDGQLECIDAPVSGFGSVTIEWRYNQIQMVKQQNDYSAKYFQTKHENG